LNIENKGIDEYLDLSELKKLIKYFDTPFEKRYKNEPSKEDYKIVENLCYLELAISSNEPLKSIISFYQIKNKILRKLYDYPIKEKIKIICTIKTHIISVIPDKLKLQKMVDLPEYSPYLLGEVMYRNIVKQLNEESKLKFIFLQLNSGGGYDFIKKDECYYLKMIPLIAIKSHLLYLREDYFFIYSNFNSQEYAFIDPYTRVESINEIKIFLSEDIGEKKDEDNFIKIGLLQFHEKGGHIKYGKKEKSPRFLISDSLDLYDNYTDHTKAGESGYALEIALLGSSNYISSLISCQNLKKLADYKLSLLHYH